MYKTVLEVLTYILQHFRQTVTVCERLNLTLFVAAKETRPPLSASLSLPLPVIFYMKGFVIFQKNSEIFLHKDTTQHHCLKLLPISYA